MFHTQMRWVGLESIVLVLALYPSCPVFDGKVINSPLFAENFTFPVF